VVSPADDPATDSPELPTRAWRARLRALALAGLGAVVAVAGYVLVADRGGDGASRAAPPAPPTTTVPVEAAVAVYEALSPSLVLVRTAGGVDGLGSGVVINEDGHVLTAEHVLSGATSVELIFADGTQSPATVISADTENDLALLDPERLPEVVVPAVLGGGVAVGDSVYPLGNPFGFTGSLTAGVVSGLDRALLRDDERGELSGLIQFDAAVNPGSSGGPLVDASGQVVGIVTALANPTEQRTFVGLGFAVPIRAAGGVSGQIER
jgi:S1-C subfamily serine protease